MNSEAQFLRHVVKLREAELVQLAVATAREAEEMTSVACAFAFDVGLHGPDGAAANWVECMAEVTKRIAEMKAKESRVVVPEKRIIT